MGLRVGRAEYAAAIVVVASASIPEVIEVEVCEDDGGRIAGLHPAELMSASVRAGKTWNRVDVVSRVRAAQVGQH